MIVKVTQMGSSNYEIGNIVTISGNNVVITLNSLPMQNAPLKIDIIENKIVDLSGNQSAPMITQHVIMAAY